MTSRNGLTAETRALAEVIREALDLPRGATLDDEYLRDTALSGRVARVLGVLDYVLDSDAPDVPQAVTELREALEYVGLGYTPEGDHDDDNATADRRRSSTERPPRDGETCPCGRPAVVVYITSKGHEVGYCGIPDGGATSDHGEAGQ